MEVKKRNLDKKARIWLKSSTSTVQKLVQAPHLEDNLIKKNPSTLPQPVALHKASSALPLRAK